MAELQVLLGKDQTPESCKDSIERRVSIITKNLGVLRKQGIAYRPHYSPEMVVKIFKHLEAELKEVKKVWNSGVKPEQKPFKF